MKISRLETAGKKETSNLRGLGIQTWGEHNDHPQRLMEITAASITGNACVNTYAKFIEGRGFRDANFGDEIVNRKMETVDDILHKVAADYACFGGFSIHCNFNASGQVVEVFHIPYEWLRFQALDDNGDFSLLAMHPDWGYRYTRLRRFRREEIMWFNFFNPGGVREQAASEGWETYKGQIYYYSNAGQKTYPDAVYSASITDMSSEEGLSNITYRNARHNFLPAGMLIDKNNNIESEEQEDETREELRQFQGDMNAGKMLYINLTGGDEAPEWHPFEAKNTDSSYNESNKNVPLRIGRAFGQPPILRAEDVGSNFGATAMREAYDFYNSQTETERLVLERAFAQIFSLWPHKVTEDYSIEAKNYTVTQTIAERLGDNAANAVELVLSERTPAQKRAILEVIYGLNPEETDKLLAL